MPCLSISPSVSLSFLFSEINQATCTWEMRWHFPVMRAMGGREESLHFQGLPSTEIDIFHYGVKMYMCSSIWAAVFVCVWQQATGRSSILLQPYPKVYVCVHLCLHAQRCMCGAPVCACVWRVVVRWKSMIYGREWCWKAQGKATPVNPDKKKNLDRSNLMPSIFLPRGCDILAGRKVCACVSVCVRGIKEVSKAHSSDRQTWFYHLI